MVRDNETELFFDVAQMNKIIIDLQFIVVTWVLLPFVGAHTASIRQHRWLPPLYLVRRSGRFSVMKKPTIVEAILSGGFVQEKEFAGAIL